MKNWIIAAAVFAAGAAIGFVCGKKRIMDNLAECSDYTPDEEGADDSYAFCGVDYD